MLRIRLLIGGALATVLALAPAAVSAHTELSSSDPADGSTVTEPPSEVVLTFEGEIAEGASFTVTGPSGDEVGTGEVDLNAADRNVLRGDVTVEDAGAYVVAYSIVGDDGDPIEGEVSFTFDPEGTDTAPTPDTAMAAPSPANAVVLVGLGMLGLAVITGLRRALRV